MFKFLSIVIIIFIVCSFLFAKPARAYLDPGAGSYVLQILLGIVLGGAVTTKIYWKKLKSIVKDKFKGKKGIIKNEKK